MAAATGSPKAPVLVLVKAYIALLRAVNVAGHQPVTMSDLRGLLSALGFTDGRTLLASGNLVFRGEARKTADLERLLEADCATRLGLRTAFVVRTADEWARAVAGNPFSGEARRDPGHLVLVALKDAPGAHRVRALQAAIAGPEIVRGRGKHVYIVYPDGIGRSRLTAKLIEETLGTRGTGRNWNTVLKLAALASE
jgi:uncharacterized protein (DUF1697 family)